MNRPNWSQRRTLAIAAVLVMVVALLALITFVAVGPKQAVGPSPAVAQAAPPTVPELIMGRHADRDGLLDFEGALEMFSYAFEPLPGVNLPSGPDDGAHGWTDLALSAILPHVSELTDAQRAVVASYLVPAKSAAGVPGEKVNARLVSYLATADPAKIQLNIAGYVSQAFSAEAARLGHTISDAPVAAGSDAIHVVLVSSDLALKGGGGAPAWTAVSHGPVTIDGANEIHGDFVGKITNCTIYFGPSAWNRADGSGAWAPGALQVAQVYHEVFHCFQGFVIGSITGAAFYATPAWVKEGGADWAASSTTGFDEPAWSRYLLTPGTALVKRAYDAFGLFFEMEYVGTSLWPDWWNVWTAASIGGWGTTDWFNAIAGDRLDAVRMAWAASYYQDVSLGHDWTEVVSGQTTHAWDIRVPFSDGLERVADPYSTLQVEIPAQGDGTVVIVQAHAASRRWIDGAHNEGKDTSLVAMCWGGSASCTCPNGGATIPGEVTRVTGDVSWAMTAFQSGGYALFARRTLGQFCKQSNKPPVPPSPPPCRVGCAGSNGDPHLRTVNGRRYDFQAAGEFSLIRSVDGSLEVQARQEPLGRASTKNVTINTAVAVRVGAHRVGVYLGASGLEFHVDGKSVTPTGPLMLDGGGTVTSHPNGVEIDLPGGSTLWALPVAHYGINVQLAPSADLASTAVGLLGAIAPGFELPKLADGSALPYQVARTASARYDYLYGPFAKAWRVTDQTSLFDYTNGATTASYDVPGFVPEGGPQASITLDASQRAAAEASCGSIIDVELRNDCVFDVTVSQDTGFVPGYQNTAAFQATGVAALDSGTPVAGSSELPSAAPIESPTESQSAVGQLQISRLRDQVSLVRGTALSPAGMLYVMVEEPDRTEILRIDTTQVQGSADISIVPPISVLDGLAFAGDSVWLVERSSTGACSVDQEFRGQTATTGAPIALDACPDGSPDIAATSDAIWVQSGPSGGSSHLVRIDPAKGSVAGSVALPQGSGGVLTASATTAFWTSSAGVFRINPASNTAVLLGPAAMNSVPSGDSVWVQRDSGTAALLDATGSTTATLTIDGSIAGANATDLFVVRLSAQGLQELWDYPVDGSASVLIAPSTPVQGVIPAWAVSSTARAPLLVGEHFVIQAIAQSPGSPQPLALQLETVQIK